MNQRNLIHIAGWVIFFLYMELETFELISTEGFLLEDLLFMLSLNGVRLITFYFFYSFVWPKFLASHKWLQLALWTATGFFLFVGVRYFIEEFLYVFILGSGNYVDKSFSFYVGNNMWWYALPIITTSAIVFLFERNLKAQKDQQQLQQEKTKAELSFLRSQVNPHFLFNTLSFLHTEAFQRDPELADMILKVSDILRYSVESTKEGKRSIKREVKLIRDYIAIFQKRFEGRCFVNFNVSGNDLDALIEPLLLIPFVENAFKHGRFSNPEQAITIDLEVKENSLNFKMSNAIKQQTKDPGSGIGVENVRRRLEVLYPDKHELHIVESSDQYKVDLSLQL